MKHICCIGFSALLCVPGLGQSERGIRLRGTSEDMWAASRALQNVMEKAGKHGLPDLAKSDDIMISIHASWEINKDNEAGRQRFLDGLEKRLGIKVPLIWKEGVLYSRATPHGLRFDITEGRVERYCSQDGSATVVADYAGIPTASYKIHVNDDGKTNRRHWEGLVWCSGTILLTGSGTRRHESVISVQGTNVVVCGVEDFGAYLEVFHLNDGAPIMRFSTCYWGNYSEYWKLK